MLSEKGFDLLLKAFFILKEKNQNIMLFAAGPIDSQFAHFVKQNLDGVRFTNKNVKNVHEVIQMSRCSCIAKQK